MTDRFSGQAAGLESPATRAFAITPDDGADLAEATRAINVAQSGAVRVMTVTGAVASVYIAAGTAFPIRATRVYATGTDAIGIVGLS